jgi:two-component system, OmpR family, sensor histidine kinase KdpD
MNDVVESITGVRVNETVPDAVLDDADVQLVDLPVETLIERLEKGKIYPEATAKRALDGFFRAGNLTALRELSLRRMAAGVDDHLDRYMRDHQIEAVWPAAERVLAALDGGPAMVKTLRRAWRLASGAHGELIAVALVPRGGVARLPADERTRIEQAIRLAEDLGAAIRVVEGDDHALMLAETARTENANLIALSYAPQTRRWKMSTIDRLLQMTQNIDIFIVEP